MKKSKQDVKPKVEDKPTNPDRIDDKWRPPLTVTEPGSRPQTYQTGKKLGKGGFAVCFEGRTTNTGEIFALKVVKAEVQQKKMMEKFRTEMQIHAKMRHPNIVEFHRAFSLEGHTYVVLELCENGSLTDMVKARSCLSLPEVRRFMIQICGGVKYLHKRSVIHRDLKMGNIFLDSKLNLKIGDFGLAAVMADEQDRRTTLCGTPNYIAPEILSKSGTRGHDYKVDTWAVGVICYAMLMGTPPFQSKTQQEIYSKLKTLEYEWKIDSINYIPQEAKDFVASCLNLIAAERPDMDELVEHDFFKTGAVADVLDRACLQAKPAWLQNADPRGDRVTHGYGIDHGTLCNECGVGKLLGGRLRPLVGAKAKISALVEIEIENRQGTAPVTPLPEGILYQQFVELQPIQATQAGILAANKPRSRKPLDESISSRTTERPDASEVAPPLPTQLPQRLVSSARPVQSFAAQQRQQALPRTAPPRTVALPKENIVQNPPSNEENQSVSQGLLKARPVRAASTRNDKGIESHETAPLKSTNAPDRLDELSDRLMGDVDRAEGARPIQDKPRNGGRTLRSHLSTVTRPLSTSSIPLFESTNTDTQTKSRTTRQQSLIHKRALSQISTSTNTARLQETSIVRKGPNFRPRLINNSETYSTLPDLKHSKVAKSLRDLYVSLGLTSDPSMRPNGKVRASSAVAYPRVDKWVDYATKHGIAYILTDGSLGMILKSKESDAAASSCIVVRNARRHTIKRARGTEHQFVPQGRDIPDIEFYEQVDANDDMKRLNVPTKDFQLDLQSHSSQSSAASALLNTMSGSAAQRMKEIGLLDKFGKYMNKQMGASDYLEPDSKATTDQGYLIHFYQRMGNVGIWRFVDGGMQFNFPDHTKLVIHQSEAMALDDDASIDVVYLEPSDAKELSAHGHMTNDALERRGLKTFQLSDIRESTLRRSEMEIVRTNEIREKLSWIRGVIGCWLKEGGLGWTGEEKLGWSGMQEKRDDKRIKLQWVTVGRPGGDEDTPAAK